VHQRLDIQGLRAIAVLLVIAYHYDLGLSRGYLGVDMFFVVSGYVISLSTIRNIRSEKSFNWRFFYRRRVRRLLPGAAIVAVFSSIFSLFALSPFGPQQKTATMLVSAATYSTNFVLLKTNYYALDASTNPLLHYWSLAVEEQFYFLWGPVVLAVLAILSRSNRSSTRVGLIILGGFVAVGSLTLFVLLSHFESTVVHWPGFRGLAEKGYDPSTLAFYSSLTRLWEFMAGVFLALVESRASRRYSNKHLPHYAAAIGVIMLVVGLSNIWTIWDSTSVASTGLNPWAVLFVVAGTVALLFAGNRQAFTNQLLTLKPLTYIGDISYTLYLWHWPIWVFGLSIFGKSHWLVWIGFAITLLISIVQHHVIEDPFRKGHLYPQGNFLKLVSAFVVIALIGLYGTNVASKKIGVKLIGTTPDELVRHIVEEPCMGSRLTIGEASTCRYRSKGDEGLIILVGDSTAKSLSDGFVAATNDLGYEAMVFSQPGCPFQLPTSPFSQFCQQRNRDVWSAIRTLKPKAVVISNLNYLYVRDIGLPNSPIGPTRIAWASETKKIFEQLQGLQIAGLLVQPVPEFLLDVRYDVTLLKRSISLEKRDSKTSGNEFLNDLDSAAVMVVADERSSLNLYTEFCQSDLCSQVQNGKFMYEDGSHLSSVGSLAVTPMIKESLLSLLP
jgi:peptidoglycan/LPS O-acetylase OafA/YrhL